MALFTYYFMKNLTATRRSSSCRDEAECEPQQTCLAGHCLTSDTTHYHDALSPGIHYHPESDSYTIVNVSESVWTESTWDSTLMRIYSQDSIATEIGIFFGGLFFLLGSFLGVHYFLSYTKTHMKSE
jgi:hypothetical protein